MDPSIPRPHPAAAPAWHRPCLALFLLGLAGRLALTARGQELPPTLRWADSLFWAAAAATSIAGLARWMPAQNALAAAAALAAFASIVELVATRTGFPFGAYEYTQRLGPRVAGLLPWPVPCIWIAFLLSSRGVARLLLRPWRRTPNYGLFLILLATALSTWLALGAEPFFAQAAVYKSWSAPRTTPTWHSIPWTFYAAWPLTNILALVIVAPWLIVKPPIRTPADYHPLLVWLSLALLCLVGCILWQCGPASLALLLALPTVATLALLSHRLAPPTPPPSPPP